MILSIKVLITFCFVAPICGQEHAEIVRLSADDWQSYRALRLRAVQEELYAFGLSYEEELLAPELEWRQRVEKMFFAKQNGKLVGMIGFDRGNVARSKHVAYIFSFYVIPEKRGQGIGVLLLDYVVNKLKSAGGVKKIFLRVTATQTHAVDFYKKFGFAITCLLEKEHLINGQYFDVFMLTMFL